MVKTTLYLPDAMKEALRREALRSHRSEAEIVRAALARMLGVSERPRPRFGQFSGDALTVEQMDAAFADGFGER